MTTTNHTAIDDLLTGLDPRQAEAVQFPDAPLVVFAGAGSGKTRVLTYRVAWMLLSGMATADSMFVSAFTKASADEMRERLVPLVGEQPDLVVGTFHSIMFRLLQREREIQGLPRLDVCKDSESTRIIRDLCGPKSRDYPEALDVDVDIAIVKSYISTWKNQLLHDDDEEILAIVDETPAVLPKGAAARAYALYQRRLAGLRKLDFDDMLLMAYDILATSEGARERARAQWNAFLIDEFQDTNLVQVGILKLLAPPETHPNITVVGDTRQCQPGGTMVLAPDGWKAIESFEDGDEVCGWQRRGQHVFTEKGSKVKVASRKYSGTMVTVTTASGKETTATAGHRFVARFDNSLAASLHGVYLMRRELPSVGTSWRVGWCKLLKERAQGVDHSFRKRAVNEGADGMWLIATTESRTEATALESIIATKYNLPLVPFVDLPGRVHYTRETLDRIFSETREVAEQGVRRLANDFGLDLDSPLHMAHRDGVGQRKNTLFETAAANLRFGMKLPVADGPNIKWEPIIHVENKTVENKTVYSFDVETHHAYVADGICTLNCLYRFRGAVPEIMDGFGQMYPGATRIDLTMNYRSVKEVITRANRLVKSLGLPDQEHSRPGGKEAKVAHFDDQVEQATEIARFVVEARQGGYKGGDVAVMIRTNAQAAQLENAFVAARLPYWCKGGGFYQRMEVGDLVAYLSLAVKRDDEQALRRIINKPTRYLGAAFCDDVMKKAARVGGDIIKAIRMVDSVRGRALSKKQRDAALDLASLLEYIGTGDGSDNPMTPFAAIQRILDWTEYLSWLKKTSGSDDAVDDSRSENIEAFKSVAAQYGRISSLLEFIDTSTKLQQDTNDATELTTVHRAKGREWPIVIVSNFFHFSFPHKKAVEEGNMPDERRVGYVAVTRARDLLVLAVPATDEKYGAVQPSPFLAEMGLEDTEEALDDDLAKEDWWGDLLKPEAAVA